MTTKKDCVFRAARELNDRDFSQRIADRAEAVDYRGYDTMIKDGKALFERDLEELRITAETKTYYLRNLSEHCKKRRREHERNNRD